MSIVLQSVQIQALFGFLDHDLLDLDKYNISFVIGDNGMGKTTLLRLIKSLGDKDWRSISRVEFDKLIFSFSENDSPFLQITILNNQNSLEVQVQDYKDPIRSIFPLTLPEEYLKQKSAKEKAVWIAEKDDRVGPASCGKHWATTNIDHLNETQLVELKENEVPFILHYNDGELENLRVLFENWNVSLIGADRLTSEEINRFGKHPAKAVSNRLRNSLRNHYSQAFTSSISVGNEFFNKATSHVDSGLDKNQIEALIEEFNELESLVTEYGYSRGTSVLEPPDENLSGPISGLLVEYLEQRIAQMKPHEKFFDRIRLFETFLHNSLAAKSVNVNAKDGLLLKHDIKDVYLDLEDLSSGEQHLIVLVYKILIETNKNTLVLIDEPELSMHMHWQEEFSQFLDQASDLHGLKYICATHSPSVLNKKWRQAITIEMPNE